MTKGGESGALFIDLSKAFDSLQHDLLLAKLNAYRFSYKLMKTILSFLSGRRYKTKINSACSDWEGLLIGVPQRSFLGPLLFNIYMCDFFLFIIELNIASYADDTTPCECDTNLIKARTKIEIFESF